MTLYALAAEESPNFWAFMIALVGGLPAALMALAGFIVAYQGLKKANATDVKTEAIKVDAAETKKVLTQTSDDIRGVKEESTQTRAEIQEVHKNTNSMKDALLKATAEGERAKGKLEVLEVLAPVAPAAPLTDGSTITMQVEKMDVDEFNAPPKVDQSQRGKP